HEAAGEGHQVHVRVGRQRGANHSNVPPGSGLWPGNMNPEADSGSARDAGPSSAAPIDPGDHPRDAPGADSPRS
ncbi:hypothetical protein P1N98_04295, partial [Tsukamurella tyrosinosolvens]|uniref:hypothetical protein n=1 Tax=Tsukamurella tyrosinosolvens TaxID=57704 RepID=UPI0024810501